MENRCHSTDINLYIRIDFLKGFNKSNIVGNEFSFVIFPITRVGVVQSEMNYRDVGRKFQCFLKFLLLIIRSMSFS